MYLVKKITIHRDIICVAMLLFMVILSSCQTLPEERIFLNGHVLTMDGENTVAEAVVIRKDRIEAVGTNDEIKKYITGDSVVENLNGKTMLPGFIDAHSHFPGSGLSAVAIDLNSPPIGKITKISELLEAVQKKANETDEGDWIFGFGYDETLIIEKRHPTLLELDQISLDHPIYLMHVSGHLGVANSVALEMADIGADTKDPEGGIIERDEKTGELTGLLEETARNDVQKMALDFPFFDRSDILKQSVQNYLEAGVTTAQNGLADEKLLKNLYMASRFWIIPMRLVVWPDEALGEKIIAGDFDSEDYNSEMFLVGAVKLIADGSIQGYTGYLSRPYHTPYKGDREYCGYPTMEREKLAALVKRIHQAGLQVAIHGNGDAAIDDIIYSFNEAQKEFPRKDARPIIIHAQMTRYDQLDAMKELGMTPSFFSAHTYYWGDRHWDIFMGPDRARRMSPAKTALDKGIRFTIHLDTPVTPMNPLLLVWSAVNRESTSGRKIGAEECISPVQALRAVTIDAAWQIFQEENRGSIEPGKYADLVILSGDPLKNPERIRALSVLETIVGGETLYRKHQ